MACTEAGEANHVNNSQRWCKGSTQMRVLGRELSSCIRRCKSMKHDLHSPWGLFSCHSWNHAARTASWTATEKLTEQGGLQIKSNRPWKKKNHRTSIFKPFLAHLDTLFKLFSVLRALLQKFSSAHWADLD